MLRKNTYRPGWRRASSSTSELLALRWQDVVLQAGLLRVSRTLYEGQFDEPKTRSSIRTVPLSRKGVEILASLRRGAPNPDALVFGTRIGTPLCRRNLRNRQLDPVCAALKIPKIGWHSLRHSNATLLDAVGTPLGTVQSLLGHSSPGITRGTYIHSLPDAAKEAVRRVEDLLIGPNRTQIEEIPETGSPLIQ